MSDEDKKRIQSAGGKASGPEGKKEGGEVKYVVWGLSSRQPQSGGGTI